ncbi:MAG: glycosyltransferase [Pseudomonadota bacterium]
MSDLGAGRKLLVFGFDAAEAAQRRRIRSYLDCGFAVVGFTMRRGNMTHDTEPFWDNVDLGETRNADMAQRIRRILGALPILRRERARMAGADVIVARNLDMLILGAAAARMIRPRPRLVYECLDIHGLMTDPGPKGQVARALERRLLRSCDALITSSPGFVRAYFEPMQGWTGETRLVENKIWVPEGGPPRPDPRLASQQMKRSDTPATIGWVGTLRCPRSLEILSETAAALGDRVRIEMYGIVHDHQLPNFQATVESQPNIAYHGPYEYPDGLTEIYGRCDLVWAQDLWQWGTNSTWLLPNRIYEAGYFGCPSIAVAGTETGRRVSDGLGWTVDAPKPEALITLLKGLSRVDLEARRRAILGMPAAMFRQSAEEIAQSVL